MRMLTCTDLQHVHLALAPQVFEQLRPLVLGEPGFLIGSTHCVRFGDSHEIAMPNAQRSADLPNGKHRPPLAEYAIVAFRSARFASPEQLLREIEPRPSQLVVVLMLNRDDFSKWTGAIWQGSQIVRLEGWRVAGPILELEANDQSSAPYTASSDEGAFSRLRGAVGDEVFCKLRRSVVSLIGVSRNGTLAASYLASLGVGHLRLFDPDVLEIENLDGMPGVSATMLGRPKVDAVAAMLIAHRPDLTITTCRRSILDAEAQDCLQNVRSHLIVTCVDSDAARFAVSILARQMLTPHIDIATSVQPGSDGPRIFGDARLFLPGMGCAICSPRMSDESIEDSLYAIAAPDQSLVRGEKETWREQRLGSLITINAVTVAAGIAAWLDLLGGRLRTSFWQRVDWNSLSGIRSISIAMYSINQCTYCSIPITTLLHT